MTYGRALRIVWLPSGAWRNDYTTPWRSCDGTSSVVLGVTCWGADASTTYSREDGGPGGPQETGNAAMCPADVALSSLP
ncbi:hypothetical protein F0U60_15030 [Archangium minus]|uniref:Uncharacterized protein n=1 Tax=Archangium minus TaxID=83450 RepID=A0ABY9WV59_9BACT|nr:hypothetical protein F0U60_15030 [Archangium minus]